MDSEETIPLRTEEEGLNSHHASSDAIETEDEVEEEMSKPSALMKTRDVLWMAPPLLVGLALRTADSNVELASYFQIGDTFNQIRHVSWLTNSFVTTVIITQPLYSRLSDIYGRKPPLLLSYVLFGLGIILCTLSVNFWALCASRAIVGCGAAGMSHMVILILNDITPLRERGLWDSVPELAVLIGAALGGVIGSTLVENFGWRIAFLSELPIPPILLVWVTFGLHLPQLEVKLFQEGRSIGFMDHLRAGSFDIYGTSVLIVVLVALLFGLNLGGNDLPWNHPIIYALFFIFAFSVVIFVYIELKVAKKPLVPVMALITPDVLPIVATGFFIVAFLTSLTYVVPYYINVSGKGGSGLGGTVNTLIAVGRAVGQAMSGAFILWDGRPRRVYLSASVVAVLVSMWMVGRWQGSEGLWEDVLPTIIAGTMIGALLNAIVVSLWKATTLDQRAIMYGVYHIFTQTSNLVAVSGIAAIIQNQFASHLRNNLTGDFGGTVEKVVEECMQSLDCLGPYPPEVASQIRMSFVEATHDSLYLLFAFGAATLISACFIKPKVLLAGDR